MHLFGLVLLLTMPTAAANLAFLLVKVFCLFGLSFSMCFKNGVFMKFAVLAINFQTLEIFVY